MKSGLACVVSFIQYTMSDRQPDTDHFERDCFLLL